MIKRKNVCLRQNHDGAFTHWTAKTAGEAYQIVKRNPLILQLETFIELCAKELLLRIVENTHARMIPDI